MDSQYWQQVDFFHDEKTFIETLLKAVDQAKSSIYIEFYIFAFDRLGQRFLSALRAARWRGVYVQLLVDGVGSQADLDKIEAFCIDSNISFRVFRPLPWTSRFFRKLPRAMWFRVGSWLRKINRRNHRKLVVLDETEAFLGSFNMVENNWRDSAVKLRGSGVKALLAAHKLAWFKSRRLGFFRRRPLRTLRQQLKLVNPFVRINATQKLRSKFYREFLHRIHKAEKRIYLVTPYFLPKRSLVRRLKKAAQRNIDIKIILPDRSDIPFLKWASFFIIRLLERNGAQFYEYQPTILHAKYYIIDDWATLGSHNLNHRSFLHDLECEAVLTEPKELNHLVKQFQIDLENSNLALFEKKQTLFYYTTRIVFMLRYWL